MLRRLTPRPRIYIGAVDARKPLKLALDRLKCRLLETTGGDIKDVDGWLIERCPVLVPLRRLQKHIVSQVKFGCKLCFVKYSSGSSYLYDWISLCWLLDLRKCIVCNTNSAYCLLKVLRVLKQKRFFRRYIVSI
jgi:hypothetical protein